MLNILKYLKKHVGAVLIVIVLLVLQAYCDLSLPRYTSDIVDVGIQQGGIERAVPETLRESSLEVLTLFMDEKDEDTVRAAYSLNGGVYSLTAAEEQLDALEDILSLPMAALYQMELSGMDVRSTPQVLPQMGQDKASVRAMLMARLEELSAQYGDMTDMMLGQVAIQAVRAEYEAQGVDMEALQRDYLLLTGAKMLALTLLMVAAAILGGLFSSRVAAGIGMELRGAVFRRVVSFSHAEIDRFSTASLITRSTNDIQQIQMVVVVLLRMVFYAPIIGIGGIVRVATTHTGMEWIIALAVAVLLTVVFVLTRIAMPRFKKMQSLIDRVNLVSREILTGLSVIRAFSREKYEEDRFDRASKELMSTQLFTNRTMSLMMPSMMLIMNGISLLIVWAGAHGIDLGRMQVGDMIAFISYTMQIVMAFLMFAMVSIMLPRAGVSAARINEVLNTEPTIADKAEVLDGALEQWKGEVVFEDVSFHYPDANADVLEHISFTAKPGQTTAIIGSTGSGKSTLLNLIPRFFDVTKGRITVDGVDVRDLSQHKLHSLLGYVPQKGVLFSGTIESNLKFGGEDITAAAVEKAAAVAQAADFIAEKPEGYRSPIAQGGSNVSGGQKQRLSIARAVAKDPKVYLFDDSFSALDYKTDAALRRALNREVADATVIIVAQRISTVLHAEQIVVLNEGKVAGIGTHEELMASCPTYQEIARSQLSESELGGVGA